MQKKQQQTKMPQMPGRVDKLLMLLKVPIISQLGVQLAQRPLQTGVQSRGAERLPTMDD